MKTDQLVLVFKLKYGVDGGKAQIGYLNTVD